MKSNTIDLMSLGMVRVATAVPTVSIGNCKKNADQIIALFTEAIEHGASIVAFPELCITGYTIADLLQQDILLQSAIESLGYIADAAKDIDGVCIVGLPLRIQSKLFNVAAVISHGKIVGIVPKINLPEYKEFYEKRWFASGRDLHATTISLFGYEVPVGTDILFQSNSDDKLIFGIEICEDVWTPLPPSSRLAVAGATILINLSASNELVGKAAYRRNLITQQSARTISGYVYVSAGTGESTTDTVFSGHCLIAENGGIIRESERFQQDAFIVYGDIDVAHCYTDRIRTTSFGDATRELGETSWRTIPVVFSGKKVTSLERTINKSSFIPTTDEAKQEVAEEVFDIQVAGLAKRMKQSGITKLVLGLSGGLDSTLALLVGVKALALIGAPKEHMHIITMPGFGTTDHTKSNAYKLAEAFDLPVEEISIVAAVTQHLADINHDGVTEDPTYENAQARYRTMILMDKANQIGGFVMGTGDLSEIALGWNTFTGDHTAPYNVNTGIPKTLIQHVVAWMTKKHYSEAVQQVVNEILATPISPELTKAKDGQIAQKTEELIGPYELHDFFLYHFIRWASHPVKIMTLATIAFDGMYSEETILKWLRVFIKRFFMTQWKRSIMPDGPKVGSVSLSPRADWRMPSDAEVELWISALTEYEK